jgi:ORF6N domain
MSNATPAVPSGQIWPLIRHIREQRVILDADLALLYGVETRALVQALKRNRDRFPADFLFQLTPDEAGALRSRIVILKPGRGRHRKYAPYAFTEHGALMAATVLNSPRAVAMSLCIGGSQK